MVAFIKVNSCDECQWSYERGNVSLSTVLSLLSAFVSSFSTLYIMCRPASSCSYTLWSLRRTAFFFVMLIGVSCKVVRKSLGISGAANCYSMCERACVNEHMAELQDWAIILRATVYPEGYCALIGTHHYTGSLWTRPDYELVDANRVCSGIHKVRVGPATRSAVATSTAVLDWNYNHKHMEWCNKSVWAEMRLTKWKPSKNFLGLCWFKVCSYGTCHSWTFIGPLGLFNLWVLVTFYMYS